MVSTVNTTLLMSRTDHFGHALLGSSALPIHTSSVVYIRNPNNWSEQERSLCERGRQSRTARVALRHDVVQDPGSHDLPLCCPWGVALVRTTCYLRPRPWSMSSQGKQGGRRMEALEARATASYHFIILATTLSHGDSRSQGRLENAVLIWATMCPDKTLITVK